MADLDTMTKADLAKEREAAEARLKAIQKAESEYDGRRLKELKGQIEKMLADEGYTLADLMQGRAGAKKSAASSGKAAAKYRHPENPTKTWSGRGRQPAWYKEALEAGKTPADLAI
ncbi:H-NS family nucleoid-associated regulatory protein [Jannaschia seohaensis]|uniref:DNA-binding protein H-NS n=1 Tax=Jannaschia seohaensis TaxID=475081 RepID=A0A2Y9A4K8_9RHOB|nr:H-NS histone family protein [Jannaschia seohaensis]PWJ22100.1 DNA-binding protein H-NS [Jannaschia seohaensis]SSA38378.1 DNA-binding protein H-NS [Jannaschia seohaensis]